MDNTLVSIVIPCFNQGRYLADAISSALSQTYDSCEVIVVNDGSTDDTSAVARRFTNIRLIEQTNAGVAAARNTGLWASQGAFVVFLDSDDRLLPEMVASGVRLLQQDGSLAFVYGHIQLIDHLGQPLASPNQIAVRGNLYARLLEENYIWTPGAIVYRAEAVRKVGGFDTRFPAVEDVALNFKILRHFPAGCNDHTVTQYRLHESSKTKNPAMMLSDYLVLLQAESEHVGGDHDMRASLQKHKQLVLQDYGVTLALRLRSHLMRGQFREAANDAIVLLKLYPRGLWSVVPYRLRNLVVRLRRHLAHMPRR